MIETILALAQICVEPKFARNSAMLALAHICVEPRFALSDAILALAHICVEPRLARSSAIFALAQICVEPKLARSSAMLALAQICVEPRLACVEMLPRNTVPRFAVVDIFAANKLPTLADTSPVLAMFNAPAIPTPPRTTNAPVVVEVEAVEVTTTRLPVVSIVTASVAPLLTTK